jgi:hypothetical protein
VLFVCAGPVSGTGQPPKLGVHNPKEKAKDGKMNPFSRENTKPKPKSWLSQTSELVSQSIYLI